MVGGGGGKGEREREFDKFHVYYLCKGAKERRETTGWLLEDGDNAIQVRRPKMQRAGCGKGESLLSYCSTCMPSFRRHFYFPLLYFLTGGRLSWVTAISLSLSLSLPRPFVVSKLWYVMKAEILFFSSFSSLSRRGCKNFQRDCRDGMRWRLKEGQKKNDGSHLRVQFLKSHFFFLDA